MIGHPAHLESKILTTQPESDSDEASGVRTRMIIKGSGLFLLTPDPFIAPKIEAVKMVIELFLRGLYH